MYFLQQVQHIVANTNFSFFKINFQKLDSSLENIAENKKIIIDIFRGLLKITIHKLPIKHLQTTEYRIKTA